MPAKSSRAPLAAIAATTAADSSSRKYPSRAAGDAQRRESATCSFAGGFGGDALGAAEKIDRESRGSGAGAELLDQLDAGHALAQRRAATARDREQADRVAQRERASR